MRRRAFIVSSAAAAGAALFPARARAEALAIPFDASWEELTFRRIPPTRFRLGGDSLGIEAEMSASVIWRPVPEAARGARSAAWAWTVTQSVPATDLALKGGDDRNAAIYFVFADADTAARLRPGTSLTRLLSRRGIRALIHVWGGAAAPGSILPSPYMQGRGVTVVRRPAGTGSHQEAVDLAADFRRAFGGAPEVLVGLAVSADSDDTGTRALATISGLTLG